MPVAAFRPPVFKLFRMTYLYFKAFHIIFVVTWFAGLFYIPRLFIYNTEAVEKPIEARDALRKQFTVMMKRLWYGITWPSAIITLIFGLIVLFDGGWYRTLFVPGGRWMFIKLCFVVLLYAYHFSLHVILRQQVKGIFKYTSQQLRIWNEAATILLIAIVVLVVVKDSLSWIWSVIGLLAFIIIIFVAINVYKKMRK